MGSPTVNLNVTSLQLLQTKAADMDLSLLDTQEIVLRMQACAQATPPDCFSKDNLKAFAMMDSPSYLDSEMPGVILTPEASQHFEKYAWTEKEIYIVAL